MTTATQSEMTPATRVANLQKNAVLLSISRGALRTRRRISSTAVETDADPGLLYVAKEILESKELDAVNQHDRVVSTYLKQVCLPSPFKAGMYLLAVNLIDQTVKTLDTHAAARTVLVNDFITWYEKAYQFAQTDEETQAALIQHDAQYAEFQTWKERLGSLWTPSDFPTPGDVRARFFFEVQILELQTPGKLKAINRELYQRELAKMQNVWEDAAKKVAGVLLEEFQGLTKRLADRLAPDADGKAKTLRTSTVQKMNDWLALFDARNLATDEELVAMVEKARKLVNGIDADAIREDDALRADLAKNFQALSAEIDQAVIERPSRRMDFEE